MNSKQSLGNGNGLQSITIITAITTIIDIIGIVICLPCPLIRCLSIIHFPSIRTGQCSLRSIGLNTKGTLLYLVTVTYMDVDTDGVFTVSVFNYTLIGLQLVFPDKEIRVIPTHRLFDVRIRNTQD